MKFSQVFAAATLAAGAVAAPAESAGTLARREINKRQALTDDQVLNFALTLEHLEAAFYQGALRNYTRQAFINAGYADPYYENVVRLRNQEVTHVNFLTGALRSAGFDAVPPCTYAFPSTNPKSYAAVSQVLEGVGVSAYSGAAAAIATDAYLTAAATILGVEARHSSYIRDKNQLSPFAAVFEIPLSPQMVFTLAAPFFKSCPPEADLGFTASPALALAASQKMPIRVGDTITLNTKTPPKSAPAAACWPLVTGAVCTPVKKVGNNAYTTTVPMGGVTGQGYVLLSSTADGKKFNDAAILAGPAIVETLPPNVV